MIFVHLLGLAAALALAMTGAWLFERRTGLSGWIDVTWSFSVGVVGVAAALLPGSDSQFWRQAFVAALVGIWSLRLGLHLARRTLKKGVDPRYQGLKQEWGKKASLRMFGFLQSQAAAGFVLVLAVYVAARNPAPEIRLQDFVALFLFVAAVAGEALADRQMRQFGANPANKGKIMDRGLWSLSRHPNYFFEWLGWVAYPLVAIDLAGGYPQGWLAVLAPALMYYLLVKVSGIPPLEKHMLESRGEAFRDYQQRVRAFWPVPRAARQDAA
jgi:steroid 5-alpha reductase family enzyme